MDTNGRTAYLGYRINRAPAYYYHSGQYRYTNLKDAIAQAELDKYKLVRR